MRFMSTQRTHEVRKSRTAVGEAPLESARHGLGSRAQAKRKATQPRVDEFPPQSNPLDDFDRRLAAARGGDSDSVDRPVSEAFLAFSNKPTTHDTTSVPIPSRRTLPRHVLLPHFQPCGSSVNEVRKVGVFGTGQAYSSALTRGGLMYWGSG